jgi:hypothetical protein
MPPRIRAPLIDPLAWGRCDGNSESNVTFKGVSSVGRSGTCNRAFYYSANHSVALLENNDSLRLLDEPPPRQYVYAKFASIQVWNTELLGSAHSAEPGSSAIIPE